MDRVRRQSCIYLPFCLAGDERCVCKNSHSVNNRLSVNEKKMLLHGVILSILYTIGIYHYIYQFMARHFI